MREHDSEFTTARHSQPQCFDIVNAHNIIITNKESLLQSINQSIHVIIVRNMTSDAMNMQINNNVVMCVDVLCCENAMLIGLDHEKRFVGLI